MKVTCPISGIQYSISQPVRGHAIAPHPMLAESIKVAQLAEWYVEDWVAGNLDEMLAHILGVALLAKLPVDSICLTGLTNADLPKLSKLWSGSIEKLLKLASRLEGRKSKISRLPSFTANLETISNMPEWLKELESELNYASQPISDKAKELNRQSYSVKVDTGASSARLLDGEEVENLVMRALRGSLLSTTEGRALPVVLSDWALRVTDFPQHSRIRWQKVIQTIFNVDYINMLLMDDVKLEQVKALEEHLMLNIPSFAVGSSHQALLMKRIAEVIPVLEDFSPAVSSRKKFDMGELLNALDGSSEATSGAKAPSGARATNGTKSQTLAEKLAARMLAASAKRTTVITAEDI